MIIKTTRLNTRQSEWMLLGSKGRRQVKKTVSHSLLYFISHSALIFRRTASGYQAHYFTLSGLIYVDAYHRRRKSMARPKIKNYYMYGCSNETLVEGKKTVFKISNIVKRLL